MTRRGRKSVLAEDASRSEGETAEESDRSQEVVQGGGTPAGVMLRYCASFLQLQSYSGREEGSREDRREVEPFYLMLLPGGCLLRSGNYGKTEH